MSNSTVLRVAISVPLRALFDYLPPEGYNVKNLVPGVRLRVPFGRAERTGVLLEVVNETALSRDLLKPVISVLDQQPFLNAGDLHFLRWAAHYYQHPSGEVVLAALPVLLRKGEPPPENTERAWQLTVSGFNTRPEELSRSPRQRELLEHFQSNPKALRRSELYKQFPQIASLASKLKEKLLLEELELPLGVTEMEAAAGIAKEVDKVLNPQQQNAIEQVMSDDGFNVWLLHGITGSGKTEVYLKLADTRLQQGKQVLVLVPEISLTPQLLQRFQQRLAVDIVALHSGLSDRERCLDWMRSAKGDARVIVGTRSAVFTPLPDLGLIVVDEEHDQSYKQQEGFRYSARDMAVALAKRFDCPVVLGSATPSLESLHNVDKGNYQLLKLNQRAGTARPPTMDLIDIRSVRLEAGLSPVTRRMIAEELDQGHQVLVFLNRRGFAPVLTCHDCGWVAQCHRCDARMTVHAGSNRIWCHHCGHQQYLPSGCPECQSEQLVTLGQGTEQLEGMLSHAFEAYKCVRIDQDTTRRKGSLHGMLEQIKKHEFQILVGTQMLSKGHDFPGVTLVVMLDVDQGLFGSDFRAAERMAQQLTQVAGRAGRGDKPGRVLIQTRHPDHPLLHLLLNKGYAAFADQALQERNEAQYPPYAYQALIRAEATRASFPENFLNSAVEHADKEKWSSIEFWGPVAASMQRKAGKHRFHLLIQTAQRQYLHQFLDAWLPRIEVLPAAKKVRWSIDIDPQDFYS